MQIEPSTVAFTIGLVSGQMVTVEWTRLSSVELVEHVVALVFLLHTGCARHYAVKQCFCTLPEECLGAMSGVLLEYGGYGLYFELMPFVSPSVDEVLLQPVVERFRNNVATCMARHLPREGGQLDRFCDAVGRLGALLYPETRSRFARNRQYRQATSRMMRQQSDTADPVRPPPVVPTRCIGDYTLVVHTSAIEHHFARLVIQRTGRPCGTMYEDGTIRGVASASNLLLLHDGGLPPRSTRIMLRWDISANATPTMDTLVGDDISMLDAFLTGDLLAPTREFVERLPWLLQLEAYAPIRAKLAEIGYDSYDGDFELVSRPSRSRFFRTVNVKEMRVIKFSADWCGPCQQIKTQVEAMCKEFHLELVEIDVDDSEAATLVQKHGVSKLPTLIFCDDAGGTVKHEGASMPEIRLKAEALKRRPDQITPPILHEATLTHNGFIDDDF